MNPKEVSHKSIALIEERFKKKRQNPLWIPDWNDGSIAPEIDSLDIIVMGSYFEKIHQSQFFPANDFWLFCLSPKIRRALIELFSLPKESVGLLARQNLFPPSQKPKPFNFHSDSTLVFAGRLSPQKNIEFLILSFFQLQLQYSSRLKLLLLGDFDNIFHKDVLGLHYGSYQKKILSLIAQLPWPGAKPQIISDLDANAWLQELPKDGLFISASTLISEDFSVSAAQCEEVGYPMLLPYWAGLAEVQGDNVRHFDVSLIADSHRDLKIITAKAKVFAQKIMASDFVTPSLPPLQKDILPSEKLNREKLEALFEQNQKRWGEELTMLKKGDVSSFALSANGQHFFKELRLLLAQ